MAAHNPENQYQGSGKRQRGKPVSPFDRRSNPSYPGMSPEIGKTRPASGVRSAAKPGGAERLETAEIVHVHYALPEEYVSSAIAERRGWIESVTGVSLGESVVAGIELPLERYVLEHLYPGVAFWKERDWPTDATALIERAELPAAGHLSIRLNPETAGGMEAGPKVRWKARWSGTPVAVWIRGMDRPAVLLPLRVVDPPNGERLMRTNFLILRREDLGPLTQRLAEFLSCWRTKKEIFVVNGPDLSFTPDESWDHLVLDARVSRLVRDDFLRFFSHREWFESKRIPFRRGYLLYGPPGNGKTSIVRAMASMQGLSPCTLVWGKTNTDDDDLSGLFRWAAEHAPSLVIMEDLDRHFTQAQHAQRQHRISLAHLLNCLDGLQSNEGVIVVATANHPKTLDPAILNRPGRFDRVVELPNPDDALRAEFFRKQLGNACSEEGLLRMVRRSAGFSFAQLRECHITASYLAFENSRDITEADLLESVELLAGAIRRPGGNRVSRPLGFPEADAAA